MGVMPVVSIVTPCHNAAQFLAQTVASVLAQSFSNWELLLIDDASGDDTPNLMRALKSSDARIVTFRFAENVGPAEARNQAITMARGKYIAFLDADDLWLPEKLQTQIAFMQQTGCALSYGPYAKMDEQGVMKGLVKVPAQVTYRDLLQSCAIGCLTAMYDAEQLGKVLMPNIRKRQDFGLWLRILKKIPAARSYGEVLAKYRLRSNSVSANKFTAARYQWKIYREVEHLPMHKSIWYFLNYVFFGVLKTYF